MLVSIYEGKYWTTHPGFLLVLVLLFQGKEICLHSHSSLGCNYGNNCKRAPGNSYSAVLVPDGMVPGTSKLL